MTAALTLHYFFFKSTIYYTGHGGSPCLLNGAGFKPTTLTAGKGECYNLRLRVKSKEESCIGITQENSMEFLSTICLPYIHWTYSLYCTNLAYPKGHV